jgi:V8-like Glu-specific endopeptidase
MSMRSVTFAITLLLTGFLWQRDATVEAQGGVQPMLSAEVETQAAAVRAYWTPEAMAAARPLLPVVSANSIDTTPAAAVAAGRPVSAEGRAPTANVKPNWSNRLYTPAKAEIEVQPNAIGGTAGVSDHFTSARANPGSTLNESTYPLRATGKLFFTTPGGNAVCSASVLRLRIVVTAGHCVHSGSGGLSGFYRNFLFVPALRNGTGPFGTFTARSMGTTAQWAAGGGAVPNAADFGMLDINDKAAGRIGNITGFYGFQTLSLSRNHTTKLGYPCNLDNCNIMQRVDSRNIRNTSPNNVEYGSNARGGSSGGPWLMNFGTQPVGGLAFAQTNRVVGITSYGYISTTPQVQGSSIPDSRAGGFIPLLNAMCALRAGNC